VARAERPDGNPAHEDREDDRGAAPVEEAHSGSPVGSNAASKVTPSSEASALDAPAP
jgi:hypothetical protein